MLPTSVFVAYLCLAILVTTGKGSAVDLPLFENGLDRGPCDKLGILLYEDLGCKPVTSEGRECPIKYECDNFDIDDKNNTCMFRGRNLALHEHIDNNLTYDSCNVGCICSPRGQFTCAILDCPEWLGVTVDYGCYRKYEVNKCCSVGQNCPSEDRIFETCKVDGKEIPEGERFYPKDTCTKCVCPKNFNGKFEEPHCQRSRCAVQIRHSNDLAQNCAPFYSSDPGSVLCCPDAWICPSSTDKIITMNADAEKNPDLTCRFGTKTLNLGQGLETKVDYYGTIKHARCECVLPPFLTCRQYAHPDDPKPTPPTIDIRPIPILVKPIGKDNVPKNEKAPSR